MLDRAHRPRHNKKKIAEIGPLDGEIIAKNDFSTPDQLRLSHVMDRSVRNPTCMVPQNDLNNMNLWSEEIPLRTHDYMQQIITEEREKEFSIYSTKNAFWKFM